MVIIRNGTSGSGTIYEGRGHSLSVKQFFRQVRDKVLQVVKQESSLTSSKNGRVDFVVMSYSNTRQKLLLSSQAPDSNTTQLGVGWLTHNIPTRNKAQKYEIFYPFCNSTQCRSETDLVQMETWRTWFLFEDINTGKFRYLPCFNTVEDRKSNLTECRQTF